MHTLFSRIVFCLVLFIGITSATAQKTLEIKKADKYYVNMEYANAIPLYEAVLERDSGNVFLKTKLADCYRKINDSRNAERLYGQILKKSTENPEIYLRYAEALSENGKYSESQKYYDLYSQKTGIDGRARSHVKSLSNISRMFRDSAWYAIDSLSMNSAQADFSPMYYQKGLVFVSGRRQGVGVKKVFNWNQSAFLDIYYLNDTALLKRKIYKTNALTDSVPVVVYNKDHKDHTAQHTPSHDDETHYTSNDTKTAGYFNSNFKGQKKSTKDSSLVRFSKSINSSYHEGPVSFFSNGDSMIFTRSNYYKGKFKKSNDGTNKLKLYTVKKNATGGWENVVEFPLNNDQYSIGHPALTPDKKTLYFVSDMPGGKGASDIWVTRYANNAWTTPENVTALNTEGNEMFPYVDENGNMYFSSDGHGGLGGLDVFYAIFRANGEFKKLKNLGYPVNSRKDDFGMIANSNQTSGYFSSNRGSGGYDDNIYSFRYLGPLGINLKGIVHDFNTKKLIDSVRVVIYNNNNPVDSMMTTADGNFRSWKLIPDGEYHVKVFRNKYYPDSTTFTTEDMERGDTVNIKIPMRKKDLILSIAGRAIAEDDKKPIAGVKIKLYNKCTGLTEEVLTSDSGDYKLPLKVDNCYLISAEKENCATTPVFVSTNNIQEDKAFLENFMMLCKGDIVKLDNIYYDLGKSDIRPDAAKELDKLLPMLTKYPGMKFELRSHTDNRGSDQANMALSDKRAKAAASYLVSKGINSARITGKGYGESIPLIRCDPGVVCSDEDHQINRRTEFKILSMGTSKNQPKASSPDTCTCKKQSVIIPEVVVKTEELVIRGFAFREQSKAAVEGVTVLVTNNTDNSYHEVVTDKAGIYVVKLKPGMRYTITASKDECATYSKDFTTEGMGASGQIVENIPFLCEGDVIKLDNIYYDMNQSDIRPDAAMELDKLLSIFKTHPSLKVELRSHTDCRSSRDYNLTLSDKRAKAASAYLISKGVGVDQVTGKGYGESQLLNDCGCEENVVTKECSEAEHQVNRRTEIKVLSVK